MQTLPFLTIFIAALLLPSLSHAQPSWSYVAQGIDSFSDVSDCIFLAGNNATGPAFTHVKGTAITSTSQRLSVASGSKWPAAAIIYRLVEEGTLNLDDLASTYLTYWTTSTSDPRHSVTVRQLLAFTGGFKSDDVCCGDSSYTLQSCAQQIYENATGPNFNAPAGSTFYYGCNNLQIAGAVAEIASNASWSQLFKTYWKTPLGITSAFTVWTPTASNPNIAGGLFCSTDEYLSWLLAIFENTYFANQNTLQTMLADETTSSSVTIGYSPLAVMSPPQVWHYCQGNWLECEQTPFNAQCYPLNVHSSPGKFGFYPRIDFTNRYWSIVARQDTGFLAYSESVQMFQQIESNVTALLSQPVISTTTATQKMTETTGTTKAASSSAKTTTSNSGGTTQSTSTDSNNGSGGGCYAASSLVRVLSQAGEVSSKPLADILPGDRVESFDQQTMRVVFEPVYFVAHRHGSLLVELVQLIYGPDELQSVKATPNHLLLVATTVNAQPAFIQAGNVRIGDFLFTVEPGNGTALVANPVIAIRKVVDQVRNPLTLNDRIVVSGVAGSVFVHSQAFYSTITLPFKLFARALPQSSLFFWFMDQLVSFSDVWEAAALPFFAHGFSAMLFS